MVLRTGIGYDIHRFAPGRKLVLGGVEIPSEQGLDGHSDADVVVHAIMDALLGAAALGDIGWHFPDTEAQWKGASSLRMAEHVRNLLELNGWKIGNVDCTILAERPRVKSHIPAMQAAIAHALGLGVTDVSVKATTNERLGAIGRAEGIAVMATALITRKAGGGDAG